MAIKLPKDIPASRALSTVRDALSEVRNALQDFNELHPAWRERVQDVAGSATCGIVTLYYLMEEISQWEIRRADDERGPHLRFSPRGIGLDNCPGCFVCGTKDREPGSNHYLHNLAAFVPSKEVGEAVVAMFGGPEQARLDYRPSEPKHVQVKVGACTAHLPNLRKLQELTTEYQVIRVRDIEDARVYEAPPTV